MTASQISADTNGTRYRQQGSQSNAPSLWPLIMPFTPLDLTVKQCYNCCAVNKEAVPGSEMSIMTFHLVSDRNFH